MASKTLKTNLRQLWAIRNLDKMLRFALGLFAGLIFVQAITARNRYYRAQALLEKDPLEAEALLVRFIDKTHDTKMRRAANYQLFYLRLKQHRFAQAFLQATQKEMRKKFSTALSELWQMDESESGTLLTRLRTSCESKADLTDVRETLSSKPFPIEAYDFTLEVLALCKVPQRSQIFAPNLFEIENPSALERRLQLVAVREQMYADSATARSLLKYIKKNDDPQDIQKNAQYLLFSARIASLENNHDQVHESCAQISKKKKVAPLRRACDFLVVFSFLMTSDFNAAYELVQKMHIRPAEIDYRLLRVSAAVLSGNEPLVELKRFTKRASYLYCAASLRDWVESMLERP